MINKKKWRTDERNRYCENPVADVGETAKKEESENRLKKKSETFRLEIKDTLKKTEKIITEME